MALPIRPEDEMVPMVRLVESQGAREWLKAEWDACEAELRKPRDITLTADELDLLRSGRGSISRDGVNVYFD